MNDPLIEEASDARARLVKCFLHARDFLATTSTGDVLETIFHGEANLRRVGGLVSHVEHVGVLIGETFAGVMIEAAREAGFTRLSSTFPSTVLAKELGQTIGRDQVPTMISIFKNDATSQAESRGLEVFVPSGVDESVTKTWMVDGVGRHAAMWLTDGNAFPEIKEAFESEGFRMPAFMNERPLENPHEKVRVAYFDSRHGGRAIRIECLWRA
jgi:hypothetical protein